MEFDFCYYQNSLHARVSKSHEHTCKSSDDLTLPKGTAGQGHQLFFRCIQIQYILVTCTGQVLHNHYVYRRYEAHNFAQNKRSRIDTPDYMCLKVASSYGPW
jgi:hypothetical protein